MVIIGILIMTKSPLLMDWSPFSKYVHWKPMFWPWRIYHPVAPAAWKSSAGDRRTWCEKPIPKVTLRTNLGCLITGRL